MKSTVPVPPRRQLQSLVCALEDTEGHRRKFHASEPAPEEPKRDDTEGGLPVGNSAPKPERQLDQRGHTDHE